MSVFDSDYAEERREEADLYLGDPRFADDSYEEEEWGDDENGDDDES